MNLLEQLIFDGVAIKDLEFFEGKLKFTLQTITGENQIAIEEKMANLKGTPTMIVHFYSIYMLCYGLVSYQTDVKFKIKSIEDKFNFLKNQTTVILDKLINCQQDFQKECNDLVNPKEIKNLSETPQSDSD